MRFHTLVLSTLLAVFGILTGQESVSATTSIKGAVAENNGKALHLAQAAEGNVEGVVGFPSEEKPATLLCAQSVSNLSLMSCIDSPASYTGSRVPFRISLAPGDYYLFSYLREGTRGFFYYHSIDGPVYGGNSRPRVVRVSSGQRVTGVAVDHAQTCSQHPQYCVTPPVYTAGSTVTPDSSTSDDIEQQETQSDEQSLICQLYQTAASRPPVAGSSWLSTLADVTGTYDVLELGYGLLAGNISDCPNASRYALSQIGNSSEAIAQAVVEAAIEEGVGEALCELTAGSNRSVRGGLRGVAASTARRGANAACSRENGTTNSNSASISDDARGQRTSMTNNQAHARAVELRFTHIRRGNIPDGIARKVGNNPVFIGRMPEQTGTVYISPDVSGHRADDAWKVFLRDGTRIGTFTNDLSRRVGN